MRAAAGGADHGRALINGQTRPLKEARAAERHDGVGQVLEGGSPPSMQIYALGGEVAISPVEVRRSLRRDVDRGVGTAIHLDAAAVTVDEAVAELLDEDERHLREIRIEVDRPIDVQRRPLVLTRDARGSAAARE